MTLLGHAAHLMPPLGVGVNYAMLDAAELALALVNAATVDDAISTYEKTMLPVRSKPPPHCKAVPRNCWTPESSQRS
ncbi:FAD-dependent monooxygenase [Amycolatopsis jiangsuensis]|uniref:2-polyprenyl-6-methoxyphenol hydroxylase-like FAD-dependent oxidoreductase n=1 Tax=Amycolatopsis jiangsuensis TaxID=1181879 RepID=A0A840IQW1_9PSEU|nr:FAD-dependent monooxygenase [Amycolatopsis jiangsuensis]MBB4683424.1 2-polyprenyl-6-methoxyphenol hydroxylase-like FAD-dependent oxidoreductase [Amycolatopsis jiangsuensis]